MAKHSISKAIFFGLSIFSFLWTSQAHKLAPALYVFGDSNVDPGNNNLLDTHAKSNFAPYGVDFPNGLITGRPTNGYNVADFFATWLGLNIPPAIQLVNTSDYRAIRHGINYASSSAGILAETATSIFPGILSLESQVDLFKKTVEEYLPPHVESQARLSKHLSKSIFLVVMGTNDYGFTLFKKINSTNPLDYTYAAEYLLEKLADRLEDLYNLGARKFVVFEIGALGCNPSYVNKIKPTNSKCVDYVNDIIILYNKKLQVKLKQLQCKLAGSTFVVAKYFNFTLNLVQNPEIFGIEDAVNPCCVTSPFGPCDENKPPCKDRDSHVFFDAFHLTQASYKLMAKNCFTGSASCLPMNVNQLAML